MDASCMLPSCPRFKLISFNESLNLQDNKHVGHCCIYSRSQTPFVKGYVYSALVSMQMRFDGRLGFPGGAVKKGEDIPASVNRELREEINLDPRFFVSQKDYVMSHLDIDRKFCLHFYMKEVSSEEFKEIERDTLKAEEFGLETLGIIRVPMFTMRDGFRGLPAFLRNEFAGNAKNQLLNFLIHSKLMSFEEVLAVSASSDIGEPPFDASLY